MSKDEFKDRDIISVIEIFKMMILHYTKQRTFHVSDDGETKDFLRHDRSEFP